MSSTAQTFSRETAGFLRDVYLPRIERALALLSEADLWWQPHPGVIAAGTILRHLEGNVRQWILSGLGGRHDGRDRASEFAGSERPTAARLLAHLEATVRDACGVIESLDEARLAATYSIQGTQPTGLYVLYHVVEHFAWHTGQLVWIAKLRGGAEHGLAFFDDAELDAARNG